MSYTRHFALWCLMLACFVFFTAVPVHAFTANSLDIIIEKDGDAIATFRFTLEGFVENAIPQSVLEEELKKGLTTSTEPPELQSMDKSHAVLLMKKFADTYDVPTGTEYHTATMDFKKAEAALQNSALSGAVSADFSPETIVLTFPDSYKREFSNVDVLPSVSHIVIDPSKTPQQTPYSPGATGIPATAATPATTGSMNVSSLPSGVKVYLDSVYIGEAPAEFPEIAPGTHTAEFMKDGYEPVTKDVTIFSGQTTSVPVVLMLVPAVTTEQTPSSPGLAWGVLIIGIIVLAAGGYYYWSEKMKEKKKKEQERKETGKKATEGKETASKDNERPAEEMKEEVKPAEESKDNERPAEEMKEEVRPAAKSKEKKKPAEKSE